MEKKIYGLSMQEVEEKRKKGEGEQEPESITKSKKQIIRENVLTLFNLLNFIIAGLLFAVGAYTNMIFIAIIILNIVIGIAQECKAKKLVDELSILNRPAIKVRREGEDQEIELKDIVKGDIVILESGSQICNDSIVTSGSLEVNESLLTGESDPVIKEVGSTLYSGSSVISGKACAEVIHVGNDNYATSLVNEVKKEKQVQSELLGSMRKVTRFTSSLIIPLGILLFLEAFVLRKAPVNESVVASAAALLGMLPKGLVLLISVSLASGVIPQITAIFGTCGGGMAVIPSLTDFTFMESKKGKMFVNTPNALEGNNTDKCDTAAADFQSKETGVIDGVGTEDEILGQIRSLVSLLPSNNEDTDNYTECTDDLNRVCADLANCAGDTAIALSQIADNGEFFETKVDYAKDMVTGFIRLNGATVGAVANRSEVYDAEGKKVETFDGSISARGARKAADFVKFCDAFDIPVLTLTNATGFMATLCSEKMMAKSVGELVAAFADATVPKVNVIIGKAYGTAYVAMNSKSIGADLVYAWDNAEIGMMDASLAAKIMYADADAATIREKAAEYKNLQSSPLSAAKRGYVDTIIEAADTRKYVIGAFEMLFTKREDRPVKKHGTV